jgi:hypothetical protein
MSYKYHTSIAEIDQNLSLVPHHEKVVKMVGKTGTVKDTFIQKRLS